ncbi:cysteine synthase 2 isoform X3 [Panicum hallii]|uniref:cysteine synthase 2 isoform X3 n=1 Tax=Panicum hallii TaxID=206008 RepID=UPI000DF4E8B7|nr:cysteine synthase 2 isoform X3 [Panicum hallii]
MTAATAAGAAAAAAAVSLVTCFLLFHNSNLKFPWARTARPSCASGRRTRRRGLVEAIGNTPLIRINSLSDATGCEILGKAEFLNPGGSVKDRVAVKIIEERGVLEAQLLAWLLLLLLMAVGVMLLFLMMLPLRRRRALEANKLAAEQRESNETRTNGLAHVNSKMTDDKLAAMQNALKKTQNNDPAHVSTEMAHSSKCDPSSDSKGGFFADQFENMANYQAHYEWTGPEIWEQTKGSLHAFVAAAGTGGTIAGVSRYLKEKNRSIKCFLMDPPGSGLFNKVTRGVMYTKEEAEGKRLKNPFDTITEGIGINRVTRNFMMAELDGAYRGTDREAVEMSRFLLRNDGLFVGSSSAMNCVGAVRVARDLGPGHTIVTILCDSGMRHLSKFFNDQYLADHGLTPTATGLEFLDK